MTTTSEAVQSAPTPAFPMVGDGSGLGGDGRYYWGELQLAVRIRGTPLEARWRSSFLG